MSLSNTMAERLMVAKGVQRVGEAVFGGSVMASRGTVITLFMSQPRAGKPIIDTNLNLTRFLMSLEDSADLALHALSNGNQGDIFVQNASAPIVGDLAQALQEVFNSDMPVKAIGTRHGEKLYESLILQEEDPC